VRRVEHAGELLGIVAGSSPATTTVVPCGQTDDVFVAVRPSTVGPLIL
jgi:hypothetical protein